jgi:hypothetical protein
MRPPSKAGTADVLPLFSLVLVQPMFKVNQHSHHVGACPKLITSVDHVTEIFDIY